MSILELSLMKIITLVIFLPVLLFCAPADSVLYMVGNAHIDLAYRWRWNETTDRVTPDTFEGVLAMLEKVPDLTYAQSQLALYESIEKTHPDIFKRMRAQIANKRWSVVGGQWAEPDAILPSGESLIRQFLIGMEYSRTHLGVQNIDIAWVPDSFCGQALTLPQIYSGCGIRYYLFGRGAPAGKQVFWWLGPDSSRVLAYHLPVPYGLTDPNAELQAPLQEWYRLAHLPFAMVIFGEGDHGGGPRQTDIDAIEKLRQTKDFPILRFITAEQFFELLNKNQTEWPSFSGEMGIGSGENGHEPGAWRGSYSSQAALKKRHRDSENLLLTAEKFATIGSMLQRKPLFPRVDFREAWKLLLRNEFHDILPGTSIADVFDDSQKDFDQVDKEGRRLLRFGLEVIGSRIDTRAPGIAMVVYNPSSWTRSDVVTVDVRFIEAVDRFTIKDGNEQRIAYQVLERSADKRLYKLLMAAENIPSIGYKVYRFFPEKQQPSVTDLRFGARFIENKYYKVFWDQDGVTGIFDKRHQCEVLSGKANRLQLLAESSSSAWNLMLSGQEFGIDTRSRPQILEKGPLRVVIAWQSNNESSRFFRELVLYAGQSRIDFRMTVDWHDHDRILKTVFPVNVAQGRATFEQPFGSIERPMDGQDWPAQNWIDLSNKDYGVALLNNGKYGFDVKDGVMRMSIVRGSRDMDPRMDEGEHSFQYALYPHQGDWKQGHVVQAALELNQPLIALQENHHIGSLPNWATNNNYSLPQEHSFFAVNSDHVIISAIKVQQGDWSPANVVLRLFETIGQSGKIKITCPAKPKSVQSVNHIEDFISAAPTIKLENDGFVIQIKPHEIRTVLIEF
jgi:alpha-mannosidase